MRNEAFREQLFLVFSSLVLAAHWKVSLEYSRGRDLTDLSKQNKFVVTLGIRN
ncbi:MAG TPA: hypothetical protein VJU82_08075 [Acidobacteriaceae bacterium]|nr:hypothetical protein [Acidobacteriaceae bacterium]